MEVYLTVDGVWAGKESFSPDFKPHTTTYRVLGNADFAGLRLPDIPSVIYSATVGI